MYYHVIHCDELTLAPQFLLSLWNFTLSPPCFGIMVQNFIILVQSHCSYGHHFSNAVEHFQQKNLDKPMLLAKH